jgi:tRNA pseudouridine55 synthase
MEKALPADVATFSRSNLGELRAERAGTEGALLLVDKPAGWTSFDVVAKVRGMLRVKKVGHTGTLDPMATGLLVLCLGKATKLADLIQAEEKQYTGTIHFGATTPTDDAESDEEHQYPTEHLTAETVREGARDFLGESMQVAPIYSARKVNGQRLYKMARRGETVEIPAKPVTIGRFDITGFVLPDATFDVICSKGTYIRSLARDLGARLGSGAYLTELRRVRSGSFHVDDAVTINDLQELVLRQRETTAP